MFEIGRLRRYIVAVIVTLAACGPVPQKDSAQPYPKAVVAWRHGDVAKALAEAKALHRPALVYWGAAWCAPCSRLNVTLFVDPRFVKLTRSVVPIHLDGDAKGAQAWGERFHVAGYPTLILLGPDGREIARPDTNQDPTTVIRALALSVGRTQSPSDLIDRAIGGSPVLSAADWSAVAEIDWRTFAFSADRTQRDKLRRLAAVLPDRIVGRRIALYSIAPDALPKQTIRFEPVVLSKFKSADLEKSLWQYSALPLDFSQETALTWYIAARLLAAQQPSARKAELSHKLMVASRLYRANAAVSPPDKMDSWMIDLTLVRNNQAAVSPAFKRTLRIASNAALRTALDAELRQSTLHEAALLRRDAGDVVGVQQMLLANVGNLANPEDAYERLSENAEMRHQPREAVAWLRRKYDAEPGRTSKFRFALDYSRAAMRLIPAATSDVSRSIQAVSNAAGGLHGDLSSQMSQDRKRWRQEVRRWADAAGVRIRPDTKPAATRL
jgi:protein disulfide-isomerase